MASKRRTPRRAPRRVRRKTHTVPHADKWIRTAFPPAVEQALRSGRSKVLTVSRRTVVPNIVMAATENHEYNELWNDYYRFVGGEP
jgi:hypothetical protein